MSLVFIEYSCVIRILCIFVSICEAIGCQDRLRNCAGWGIDKLYLLPPYNKTARRSRRAECFRDDNDGDAEPVYVPSPQ